MKIIILKDTPKVGKKYDIKEVNDGYALNLLIPKGIAIPATPQAVKKVEAEKALMAGERKVQEDLLAQNIKAIESVTLTISAKANPKGLLFAGVHREEIAKDLGLQARIQMDPTFIDLDHPLKEVGEHSVSIKAGGKTAKLKVVIKAL
jgi:large subunit ribosomal protein L9